MRYIVYLFISFTALAVINTNAAVDTSAIKRNPEDQIQVLSPITVTEQRTIEGEALAEQHSASNIINVITSSDISKNPDVNVAEALRRIPGITLWTDTGEGRFIAIRGLDSDLNSTTFSGIRLLPTNPATIFGGGRAVALDVIPSGVVGSMVVTKTNKPEQDAEALGGTVDISPRTIPVGKDNFGELRLGSGYEKLRHTPIIDFTASGGVKFNLDGSNSSSKPFSFVGTVSFYTDARGINDVEPGINNNDNNDRSLAGYDQRYYSYHRFRHGFGGELGYQPDTNNRYFLSVFNTGYTEKKLDNILTTNFDDNFVTKDNKIFTDTLSDGAFQKTLANHQEKLSEEIMIFTGENKFGDTLVDYKAAHIVGTYNVFKDVSTSFNSIGSGTVVYDNSGSYPKILSETAPDKSIASNYTFGGYRSSLPYNQTKEDTYQVNVTAPLNFISNAKETIKFGLSDREKHYNAEATYLTGPVNKVTNISMASYVTGSNIIFYHGFYNNGQNLSSSLTDALIAQGGIVATAKNKLKSLNAHASDKETVAAGYLQYDVQLNKFDLLLGLRDENTKGSYQGNVITNGVFTGTATHSASKDYLFPAISLKYDIARDTDIRLSRSTTIGRPGFNQISANTQVDTSGKAVTSGNPDLKSTQAASYDLVFEHYIGKNGMITAGLFYKDLSNYIVSDVLYLKSTDPRLAGYGFTGNTPIAYQTYSNVGNSYAQGFELAAEIHFTTLPGVLSGLGASANMTYVDSKFTIRPGETHSLPSTAKNTYNASLFYTYKPVEVRLSYSHVDRYISGIGSDFTQDTYTDPMNWLDLSIQYNFSKKLGVYFNVKNINDQPLKYTQGTTYRTIQREYYGQTYQIGVTAKY